MTEAPGQLVSTSEKPPAQFPPLMATASTKIDSSIGYPPEYSDGRKLDMTASLIVNDRSRNNDDIENQDFQKICRPGIEPGRRTSQFEATVKLAGPMRNWDPLYMLLIVLGMLNCLCCVCAIFLPYFFTFYNPLLLSTGKSFALFDSKPCSSYARTDGDAKKKVCYEGSKTLGIWVLAMQVTSTTAMALSVISLALQLINLCVTPRNRKLHDAALYFIVLAGVFQVMTAHISHNRSVWGREVDRSNGYVVVEPLSGGLFFMAVVLSSWICVTLHITQHAPGPLSMDTRFLHTLVEERVVEGFKDSLMAIQIVSQAPMPPPAILHHPTIEKLEEEEARDSVHSTEV